MLALFISSLLLTFFSIVIGIFVIKVTKIPSNNTDTFLIGIALSNSFTTCISLIFPINIFILGCFILGCFILTFFIREELKSFFSLLPKKRIVILSSIPFILIAFNLSLFHPIHYDTGLYYLQSIKWIENYPVVPGLANLHGRFGFNPNIFTLFALVSLQDVFKQEIFSINFTAFSVLVFYFVNRLYSLYNRSGFSNLFFFYAFVFYSIIQLNSNLSSPTPDFLNNTILLYIFARVLDLSIHKESSKLVSYIPILILSIYVVSIKLSSIPIVLLFLFVIIQYKSELKRSFWVLLTLLSFITLPWLIRNIILSGWLIYPFHSIDLFNFDWKVPTSDLLLMNNAVTGYARIPNEHYLEAASMGFSDWFPIWWQRIGLCNKLYFASSLTIPIVIFIGQLIKKIKVAFFTNTIIITSFIGVLFWLFMAPDFRFGKPFIIIATISPLFCFFWAIPTKKVDIYFGTFIIIMFVSLTIGNINIIKANTYQIVHSDRYIRPQRIKIPNDINFKSYHIRGCSIFVPTIGDQCFDHDLPCTPYLDSTIVLRGNTMMSGFRHLSN